MRDGNLRNAVQIAASSRTRSLSLLHMITAFNLSAARDLCRSARAFSRREISGAESHGFRCLSASRRALCCSSLSNCPLGMHSARNHPAPSDENVRSQTTTSTQYFPHLRQVRGFRQLGLQTTDLQCHGNLFRRGTTSSRIKLKNTTPVLK